MYRHKSLFFIPDPTFAPHQVFHRYIKKGKGRTKEKIFIQYEFNMLNNFMDSIFCKWHTTCSSIRKSNHRKRGFFLRDHLIFNTHSRDVL